MPGTLRVMGGKKFRELPSHLPILKTSTLRTILQNLPVYDIIPYNIA